MTENEFKQLFGWMENNPTWSREFTAINEMRLKLEEAQAALRDITPGLNMYYPSWRESHAAALKAAREQK